MPESAASSPSVGSWLVDGHVHFHPSYDEATFLDSARSNFLAGAVALGLKSEVMGVLLLAETNEQNVFRQWRAAQRAPSEGWSFRRTREDCSLVASRKGRPCLVVVAGRQVTTAEGLEVLAIGSDYVFPSGLSLADAIAAARAAGALPVIPWGFGKWWLGRGKLVADALAMTPREPLFLGDNGGRLGVAPAPRLFATALGRGMFILPGSDPLPLPGQERRAGSYGFVLNGTLDAAHPTASLRRLLLALHVQPRTFGNLERAGTFLRNQVLMQIRKRGSPP